MNRAHPSISTSGLVAGLGAYVAWGFMPLLFHNLRSVPPLELVAWRVVFTLPVCLLLTALARGWGNLWAALLSPWLVLRLIVSAALIACNWLLYVNAVVHGHVLATSLGYYINPLLNVLIGTLFLGERLRPRQWAAVMIAAAGIALLLAGAIAMLTTALLLAGSFAGYGLMRKFTPVTAITGLTVETMTLYPLGAAWALLASRGAQGSALGEGGLTTVLLIASGFITATPLILFAVAARRLPFSLLGFLQFIAPTIVFVIGIGLGEALNPVRLACFVLIWIAVVLFAWDTWQSGRSITPRGASSASLRHETAR